MNIAIIADDLTGAAELASASADLGFTTEVHTQFDPASAAEVIAIDSNTRALPPARAAAQVAAISAKILRAGPKWIYKKTDSVLRGNVRVEIEAILEATRLRRATLISANPSKGRVMRGGSYFVNNIPLHETAFAHDPDHPRRTSDVLQLLGNGRLPLASTRLNEPLLAEGISVPDADVSLHLATRAGETPLNALAAGGVEFFQAMVRARTGRTPSVAPAIPDGPTLRVCGSAHAWGQGRAEVCARAGIPVFPMPEGIYARADGDSEAAISQWSGDVIAAIASQGQAMIAIGRDPQLAPSKLPPQTLVERLAHAVTRVHRASKLQRVQLEGGATAAAVLHALNWTKLIALPSARYPGVAALQAPGSNTVFLMKPGSYPWPDLSAS